MPPAMGRAEARSSVLLGSAGSLPAVFGSLPNTILVGKLQTKFALFDSARRMTITVISDRLSG